MSDVAIRVEGLGKAYRIGQPQRYRTLRDSITGTLGSVTKSRIQRRPNLGSKDEAGREGPFWALRDVSFEVKQGEVVGVLGRNGAGKSTLLKILSRVTEPTEGSGFIRGRTGSLLEVGTGFHPELTGRENVYLNGAVLGMHRAEIRRKFDAIVAFAEVEQFIDTPVKFYSSGMYLRLAFAVAAHLDPEVLFVDEVLAVGDVAFQKKCLDRMRDVTTSGQTVVLVSHSLATLRALCRHTVYLDHGRLRRFGDTDTVVREYLTCDAREAGTWKRSRPIPPTPAMYFTEVAIHDVNGSVTGAVGCTEPFSIELSVCATDDITRGSISATFVSQDGTAVFTSTNNDRARAYTILRRGRHRLVFGIPKDFLAPGTYTVVLRADMPGVRGFDVIDGEIIVHVEETGSNAAILRDGRQGLVTPVLDWRDDWHVHEATDGVADSTAFPCYFVRPPQVSIGHAP